MIPVEMENDVHVSIHVEGGVLVLSGAFLRSAFPSEHFLGFSLWLLKDVYFLSSRD